jgi:hypothetical protein
MFENSLKTRERAESAFARTQTQYLARSRVASERDDIAAAQIAKTNRLRALRLQKEATETAKAPMPAKVKRRDANKRPL